MRLTALLASALLLSGCGNVHTAGQDLVAPSPVVTPGVQTRLVLTASSRSDQQLDVTAQVLDGRGVGIPNVDVQFAITGGTVTPQTPVKTDATGTAKAVALTSGQQTLSATTGALTSTATVIGGGTALSVNLFIGAVTVGTASSFSASVTGTPLGGPFAYAWTFGDGTTDAGSATSNTHTYAKSGTFSASVKVTDGSGRTVTAINAAIVNDPPAPPVSTTPPVVAATLSVVTTCTPVASPGASSCNVNLTYGGTAVSVTNIQAIDWDWGDGTAPEMGLPASSAVRTHAYLHPGMYLVIATARATTSGGTQTGTGSKSITVN